MTKVKSVDLEETIETPEKSYSDLLANLNPIAKPLAGRKLTKRIYKCIKKDGVVRNQHAASYLLHYNQCGTEEAVKQKNIRRGVKEVQKFLNKGEKGIVILAGDTLPIEVYCHIPVMCEDLSIPYAYTPSKSDLGAAAGSKRPTCVILIKPHSDYQEVYDYCLEEVQGLPLPY